MEGLNGSENRLSVTEEGLPLTVTFDDEQLDISEVPAIVIVEGIVIYVQTSGDFSKLVDPRF